MKKAPNRYRINRGQLASDESMGNNGAFLFPHFRIAGYEIFCIISDGEGWEHVSVTITPVGKIATRCPTWEEMCWVKGQFWNEDECVIEYHPPKSEYVSCHPFCLHLWKSTFCEIPIPNSEFVGPANFKK